MEQNTNEYEGENRLKKDGICGGFDCNICLEPVQDPVVTLCGHLYCWPCIYRWIHHQTSATEFLEKKNPRCPVCNHEVSKKMIVPVYSYGVNEKKPPHLDVVIPPRPTTPRYGVVDAAGTDHHSQMSGRGFHQRPRPPPLVMPVRGGVDVTNPISPSPTIGMLGEMVSGRIFGDAESPLFGTPNSYSLAGVDSRRARRQVTRADRSLSRIYTFMFCCIILCLLLFT